MLKVKPRDNFFQYYLRPLSRLVISPDISLAKRTGVSMYFLGRIRPTKIGLGHELIHAALLTQGKSTDHIKVFAYDPDHNRNTDKLSIEEIEVRKEENILRDENGVSRRVIPTIIKKNE